ncbi:MAG: hydantoinase/oxoprolinase family protein, partial [Gemmatimonadota bacterium]
MDGLRIGVDVGGTFTDFVLYDPEEGTYRTLKVLSTPGDPSEGVRQGLGRADADDPAEVVHGSTVATNAVLERKGARTALVTTEGFRDLLSIARQERADLYDLAAGRPEPLVPRELCFAVDERVDAGGNVLGEPGDEELEELARRLEAADVESVAVSLLFSFLHPEHEERVADRLREAGMHVSRSSEILPEFREYERASTTAVNAFVAPILDRYLERLDRRLSGSRFRIMQSNGGSVGTEEARRHGVRSILSGPAGGAVGALRVARAAGRDRVVSFDMGGTSTDVSLMRGDVEVTTEAKIGGLPIRVPVVDIHTVGAGGGSVGRVDAGGALRVGPESAGADPGPACYGRGGERPTVTDAHVVLGRLPPDAFLGGRVTLDAGRAEAALSGLASATGCAFDISG